MITIGPQRLTPDAELVRRIALRDYERMRGERDDAMARLKHAAERHERMTAADAFNEVVRLDAAMARALEVARDPAFDLWRREREEVRLILGGAP